MTWQLHQLYDTTEHSDPITGLYLEPFPNSNSKCYIMVTTPRRWVWCDCEFAVYLYSDLSRIYQFIGGISRGDTPQFGDLFLQYQNVKGWLVSLW